MRKRARMLESSGTGVCSISCARGVVARRRPVGGVRARGGEHAKPCGGGVSVAPWRAPRRSTVAMINVDLGPSTLLGVALIGGGMTLFGIRGYRPQISKDEDVFFSSVSLLCGGILIFQGWRLDPILLFSQILMSGTAVYFAAENVRMRNAAFEGRARGKGRSRRGRGREGRGRMGEDGATRGDGPLARVGQSPPPRRRAQGAPAGRPLPPAVARTAFREDEWGVEGEEGAAPGPAAPASTLDGFVEWEDREGGD